jgi:exodeoxyribonuclease VII large subunit
VPQQSSADAPLPVRTVARLIAEWVDRLGRVWVEGQVTQLSRRTGAGTAFITLRDPVAEVSLTVTCPGAVCDAAGPALREGARVVVHGKPEFYLGRGTLSLAALEIRPLGLGALLARIEAVKRLLQAEGLFAAERKRPLPFLPRCIGLVTGRASAAERDVLEHARRRWPGVRFRPEPVPVQGPSAVAEIVAALRRLDTDPDVDVILLARGGGSVEDLLPFSDETLCRAVAACGTPVVTAIGHETDNPLVDFVADRRASTPTDAAKILVPDVAEESARVQGLRDRSRRVLGLLLTREHDAVHLARTRSLALLRARLDGDRTQVAQARGRIRRCMRDALAAAGRELEQARGRVRALSPAATLARGYAVLLTAAGAAVSDSAQVQPDDRLRARLARGQLTVVVESADQSSTSTSAPAPR